MNVLRMTRHNSITDHIYSQAKVIIKEWHPSIKARKVIGKIIMFTAISPKVKTVSSKKAHWVIGKPHSQSN